MRETDTIEVLLYETANAVVPIEQWLDSLDRKSRARILARIAKIRSGNLGDWSSLTNAQGVCEFREFFGPGYRIYFARESQKIVILLCGSDKSDQKRTIKLASQYWLDYQQRSANDEVRE